MTQTSAGIMSFLYMLFLLPEVAERIHEEIEGVTQGLRLPRITDRSQLPYTEAVWKEAIRWHPFNSLGTHYILSKVSLVAKSSYTKVYHMLALRKKLSRDT
jgi:cytochrome P450